MNLERSLSTSATSAEVPPSGSYTQVCRPKLPEYRVTGGRERVRTAQGKKWGVPLSENKSFTIGLALASGREHLSFHISGYKGGRATRDSCEARNQPFDSRRRKATKWVREWYVYSTTRSVLYCTCTRSSFGDLKWHTLNQTRLELCDSFAILNLQGCKSQ